VVRSRGEKDDIPEWHYRKHLTHCRGLALYRRRVADGAPDRDLIRIAEFLDEMHRVRAESETNLSASLAAS